MKKRQTSEQKQRFSFRKLSSGLVSALVGISFFAGPISQVSAQTDQLDVSYHYVIESELSDEERQNLKEFVLHDTKATDNTAYYFVYRPSQVTLPQTGAKSLDLPMALTGTGLLIVAVYISKKRKTKTALFLLSLAGLSGATQVSSFDNVVLGHLSQMVSLSPEAFVANPPEELEGYRFTGYYLAYTREETKVAQKPLETSEIREEPTDQGTQPILDSQPQVTAPEHGTSTQDVILLYQKVTVEDTELETGEVRVDRFGKAGLKRLHLKNGEVVAEDIIEEAINELVRVGVKQAKEVQISTQDIAIPYQVEEVIDPDLYQGESTIVQEGKEGILRQTLTDGQVTSEEVLKASQNQIVKVGSKAREEVVAENHIVDVAQAYETQEIMDPDLLQGERVIDQTGQDGIIRQKLVGGKVLSETIISPSRPQIIRVGTKVVPPSTPVEVIEVPKDFEGEVTENPQDSVDAPTLPVITVQDTSLAFLIEKIEDADLYQGETIIEQAGQPGIIRQTLTDGVVSHQEIIQPAVNQLVRVGTKAKPVGTVVTSKESSIAYDVEEEETAELYQGQQEIIDPGQPGVLKQVFQDGVLISEEVISPAQNRKVRVGTRPVKEQIIEVNRQPIAYKTIYKSDPNQELGQETVVQEGFEGQETITTITNTVYGQIEEAPLEIVHVNFAPQDRVINRGSKPTYRIVEEELPVRYEATVGLGLDETLEVSPGVAREVTYTKSYQVDSGTGEVSALEEVSQVTNEGQARLVQVGTAPTITQRELPYAVRHESDDQLAYGVTQTLQSGQKGQETTTITYVLDSTTGEVTAQPAQVEIVTPRDEIVVHGIAPTVMTSELNYTSRYQDDPSLEKGELKPYQEGKNGLEIRTTRYHFDPVTGLVTAQPVQTEVTPAQEEIILKGTRLLKPQVVISQVLESDSARTADVFHQVIDSDAALKQLKTQIYKGEQLVAEVEQLPTDLISQFNDLEYFTDYRVQTLVTYDLGTGLEEEVVHWANPIRLELKKVELKDIDQVEVYKNQDGKLVRYLSLNETAIQDPSQYLVKLIRSDYKDLMLPVAGFKDVGDQIEISLVLPELISREGEGSQLTDNQTVTIAKTIQTSEVNVFTSFAELIKAMASDLSGNYILAADVSAQDWTPEAGALAYVTGNFTGSLTSTYQGKTYAIHDQVLPLFTNLRGAKITDLHLKDVAIITNNESAAALSIFSHSSQITRVSVQGEIQARRNVAGLVNSATNGSAFNDVAFKGILRTTAVLSNSNRGGLVGTMSSGSLTKGAADVTITATMTSSSSRAGGLVSVATGNATIRDSYVTGSINNIQSGGQVGGAVGSTYTGGIISNVISSVAVTNGTQFYGDAAYKGANVTNAYTVAGQSRGEDSLYSQEITSNQAMDRISELGITADDSFGKVTSNPDFDYSQLPNFVASRQVAYANTEKLLPLYNREFIVEQGNKIDLQSNLANKKLVAIVAMADNQYITDYYSRQGDINGLLLHYQDGTVEKVSLQPGQAYKDSGLVEYQFADGELLYTPEQFLYKEAGTGIGDLARELKSQSYMDLVLGHYPNLTYSAQLIVSQQAIMQEQANAQAALDKVTAPTISQEQATAKLREDKVDPFYLAESYSKVQDNLETYLNSLVAQSLVNISSSGQELATRIVLEKIRQNKEAILLGLSYMTRLYDIDYGTTNIKELSLFKQDFFGQEVDHLDWLIRLGNAGQNALTLANNDSTYRDYIGSQNGQKELFDYLEAYHSRFSTKSLNDWLKETSAAHVIEKASQEVQDPRASADLYEVLKVPRHQFMILPLLTLKTEGVFVLTTMSSISLGMYDRYIDMSLAKSNPARYESQVANLKIRLEEAAERQRRMFDMWYRIVTPEVKETLFDRLDVPVPSWDGYRTSKGWQAAFGETSQAILDFFGPLNKWYANNGAGAYAGRTSSGSYTHFVINNLVDEYGASVFSHESVHNFDATTILGGYGRREGAGAEAYALGMFQSASRPTDVHFTWNMTNDYQNDGTGAYENNRNYNSSPDRFEDVSDLEEYFKGVFDVLYTMDAIEGEAWLSQPDSLRRTRLKTMVQEVQSTGHANDVIRQFTDAEWQSLELNTLEDLVKNNVVVGIVNEYSDEVVGQNTYHTIHMFAPIYGAHTNTMGIAGNNTFKRLAFELLADKGYAAMVGYISNQYKSSSEASGQKVLTDAYIVEQLFAGEYKDFADFKYAMLNRRLQAVKAGQLKEISFSYGGKTYQTDYATLKQLITDTMTTDPTRLVALKQAIFRAYLHDTDDFRSSVYKSEL